MIKFKDTDFLYASARTRCLENYMLGWNELKKMVEAKTIEEAYKIATDKAISTDKPISFYEQGLIQSLDKTYSLVEEIAPDPNMIRLFRLKYDGHNLKTLIKASKLDGQVDISLSPLGMVDEKTIYACFKENDFRAYPEKLATSAVNAIEALAQSGNPQMVDVIIDHGVMSSMLNMAYGFDIKFLHSIVVTQIDIANIRSLIRLKRMKKDSAFLKTVLLEGGSLDVKKLISIFPKTYDEIWSVVTSLPNGKYFDEALVSIKNGGRLTLFEKLCDNYLTALLRSAKLVPFGAQPIISYLLAKEVEVQAVRIIIASKLGGVDQNLIIERLRETYA